MVDRDLQIVFHAHARKESSSLRHHCDPAAHQRIRCLAADWTSLEANHLGRNADQSHDRFEKGRFAGSICSDQGDDLPGVHRKIDGVEGLKVAVPCRKAVSR